MSSSATLVTLVTASASGKAFRSPGSIIKDKSIKESKAGHSTEAVSSSTNSKEQHKRKGTRT